ASVPPILTSRSVACSSRCGGGAANRSMTSPMPTRSRLVTRSLRGGLELQVEGGAEDQRGAHRLEVPVIAEHDTRRAGRPCPRREPRQIDQRRQPPGGRGRGAPKASGRKLRAVAPWRDVVRALVLRPRAPDDCDTEGAVGVDIQFLRREGKGGGDEVVDVLPLREPNDVVHEPSPPQQE